MGGWSKAFGIPNSEDIIVVKMSKDGNLEWIKLYGGTASSNFIRLISTDDGGVLALGNTTGFG